MHPSSAENLTGQQRLSVSVVERAVKDAKGLEDFRDAGKPYAVRQRWEKGIEALAFLFAPELAPARRPFYTSCNFDTHYRPSAGELRDLYERHRRHVDRYAQRGICPPVPPRHSDQA